MFDADMNAAQFTILFDRTINTMSPGEMAIVLGAAYHAMRNRGATDDDIIEAYTKYPAYLVAARNHPSKS